MRLRYVRQTEGNVALMQFLSFQIPASLRAMPQHHIQLHYAESRTVFKHLSAV
jgi:hypothetical protein